MDQRSVLRGFTLCYLRICALTHAVEFQGMQISSLRHSLRRAGNGIQLDDDPKNIEL